MIVHDFSVINWESCGCCFMSKRANGHCSQKQSKNHSYETFKTLAIFKIQQLESSEAPSSVFEVILKSFNNWFWNNKYEPLNQNFLVLVFLHSFGTLPWVVSSKKAHDAFTQTMQFNSAFSDSRTKHSMTFPDGKKRK